MSTEQLSEKYLGVVGMSGMSVRQGDTANAHGSGDVPVLATPQVIALAESATSAALLESMEQGETSVGIRVEFDHVSTASIGAEVRATLLDEIWSLRELGWLLGRGSSKTLLSGGFPAEWHSHRLNTGNSTDQFILRWLNR